MKEHAILAIDDDPVVLALIARVLKSDYQVAAVTSATDALQRLARGEHYDLVLCDLMMEGMDGVQLYQEVGRLYPDLQERMVFLTGGAYSNESARFLEGPAPASLTKPFSIHELRGLVARFIPSAQD